MNDQKELAGIFTDYANNLPEKISNIKESWNKLNIKWNALTLQDLHNRVHSLHGSAGMFGYKKLSDAAGELELLIDTGFKNEFSLEQKEKINQLMQALERQSKQAPSSTLSIPEKIVALKEENNEVYMLNIGKQLDSSIPAWADETKKRLGVFGYKMKNFTNFEAFEEAIKVKIPFIFLVNLSLLSDEDAQYLLNLKEANFPSTPMIFFANSGDFSLRIRAVKLGGQAYLIKPFLIDDLIYEFNRIKNFNHDIYQAIIVDDEIEVANYHAAVLTKANVNCKTITNVNDLDNALHQFKPDVILMDYYMPVCNGKEIASIIRQQREYEFVPILFLSSEEDINKQLDALKTGGDDFISKKIQSDHLTALVRTKAYRYKILRSMMSKDNATTALNEEALLKKLEQVLIEAKQSAETVSIAVITINNFDKITTNYGVQVSDQVLKSLCLMLRARTRIFDEIGRYHGKVVLLMPDTKLDAAKTLVRELQNHFLSLTYYAKNQIFNTTFSAGVASTDSGYEMKALLEEAEQGLKTNPVKALG